jgi:B3 DNA binding domain
VLTILLEIFTSKYYKVFCLNQSIPKKFSAEHLPKESQDLVLYCPVKKKTWEVRYFYGQYQQFIRYAGWGKFVQENNLRVGDACLFELIKISQPITFVVQVSRA